MVVPVFDPGTHIDPLLKSLRRQSLPAEDFEVIFVDDGSTDGTAARLERLAAKVPNYRFFRISPSGGPGEPRNVGVREARGEYVQFVDNDDYLGDEALERLWAYAKANGSDVVVGREVRPNRPHRRVGHLFRRNRPSATIENDPLLENLTPHKMFRRQFLIDEGIWFLAGARRLIDNEFVVKSYLRAATISVLSDYPCYHWVIPRPDRSNATYRPRVWRDWYDDMRSVLDAVEQHTEPGDLRDRLLAHWYDVKCLSWIGAPLEGRSKGRPRELLEPLRELAEERFPPAVDERLSPILRVRSALLRGGHFAAIEALAAAERGMRLEYRLGPDRGPGFEVSCTLTYRDGAPVLLERTGDRWYWVPPVDLGGSVPRELLDFTEHLSRTRLDVTVRHHKTGERDALRGRTRPWRDAPRATAGLGATRIVRLDQHAPAGRLPLRPGLWTTPLLQLRTCGWVVACVLTGVPGSEGDLAHRMSFVVDEAGQVTRRRTRVRGAIPGLIGADRGALDRTALGRPELRGAPGYR